MDLIRNPSTFLSKLKTELFPVGSKPVRKVLTAGAHWGGNGIPHNGILEDIRYYLFFLARVIIHTKLSG